MSFIVHIPLVCFGIAFPRWSLFAEGLWLRTGDPRLQGAREALVEGDAGALRGRRRHRDDPVVRARAAVAELHGDVRRRLRARRSRSRASRSSSRRSSSPSTSTAGTGSRRAPTSSPASRSSSPGSPARSMVIAVNGWMNDPTGFDARQRRGHRTCSRGRRCSTTSSGTSSTHMYLAGYMVAGFLVAGVYARGMAARRARPLRPRRARRSRSAFAALAAPVQVVVGDWAARTVAEDQPVKLAAFEGPAEDRAGAPFHIGGIYEGRRDQGGIEIPELLSMLAYHDPNGDGRRASTPCRPTTARRSTWCGSRSRRWSSSARGSPLLGALFLADLVAPRAAAAVAVVLPRASSRRPARRWSP